MFSALGYRDYRYLIAGTFVTQMGQWVQQLGKGWLVYDLTKSPFQLGLAAFFAGAGMALFAPLGGAVADRFDRRNIMVASQFGSMMIALLVAVLVLTDAIRVWHIYCTGFASSAMFSFNNPTRQALVNDLVPKEAISNAVALNSVSANGNRVLGPSIGGALLALIGIHGTFFFQAATLMVAMYLALQIRPVPPSIKERLSFKESIVGGITYARKDRDILLLLVLAFTSALLAWPYMQLLPAYTTETLGMGKTGFGLSMSAIGVGAVTGSLLIATRDVARKGRVLLVAEAGSGVLLIALGFSSVIPISFAILVIMGLATAGQMAMSQILIQTKVDDRFRGRVLSLYFLGFGLQPLSTLPAGAIAERWGVPTAIFILGALLVLIAGAVLVVSKRARAW